MLEIDRNPSSRDLWIFALILPIFFGIAGVLCWRGGMHATAGVVWIVGAVASVVAIANIDARRHLYVGWMVAAYPIGWVVSRIILAVIYFVVATPIALILRVLGRDPLQRSFDKKARTYWAKREADSDPARYFRQF